MQAVFSDCGLFRYLVWDVPCVKCGAVALDTGLECSECGHDNYEAVTGRPFAAAQKGTP